MSLGTVQEFGNLGERQQVKIAEAIHITLQKRAGPTTAGRQIMISSRPIRH